MNTVSCDSGNCTDESEVDNMGLWKNLKYVLSDECNGLLRLLVDNYNKKTDKSEKTIREIALKVQQTLETQEVLDNNLSG